MTRITIDGTLCEVESGQSVLGAARASGIYIPSLCWHRRLGKASRCRTCVVEVEGMRGLQESCATEVADGMVVRTDTETARAVRTMVAELLLSSGSHNCIACEASGRCELEEMAYRLGIEKPTYLMETEAIELDTSSEGIIRDVNRCILCGRCVKACNENVMHRVLNVAWRSTEARLMGHQHFRPHRCRKGQATAGGDEVAGRAAATCDAGHLVVSHLPNRPQLPLDSGLSGRLQWGDGLVSLGEHWN